jgi:hypothetical protein
MISVDRQMDQTAASQPRQGANGESTSENDGVRAGEGMSQAA